MTQDYWGKGDLEFIKEYLKNDEMPDYWNRYGEDYSQWGVYANTDYYAFAIAQNAKGEWGPLATLEFRTPASAPGAAPAKPGRPCVRLERWSICTAISSRARPPMLCRRAESLVSPS